jgi:pentatricopeptide repeat protein
MTPCRLCLRTLARGKPAAFLGSKRWPHAQTILHRRYTHVVAAEDDTASRIQRVSSTRATPEDISDVRNFIMGRVELASEAKSGPDGDNGDEIRLRRTLADTFHVPITNTHGDRLRPKKDASAINKTKWDGPSFFWRENTAKLVGYEEWRMDTDSPTLAEQFHYAAETPARAKDVLQMMDEGRPIWSAFEGGEDVKSQHWEEIALYIMQNTPSRALDFLQSCLPLYNSTKIRHFRRLHYYIVAYWWNLRDHPSRMDNMNKLAELLPRFGGDGGMLKKEANAWLWRVLTCCSFDAAKELLVFMDEDSGAHWHTWLQATTLCVKNREYEAGLHTLLQAHNAKADLPHLAFAKTFAAILRAVGQQPDGLRVSMRFYDYLSKCGMPLTTTVCNVLMMNASDAGDLQTSLAIHKSMLEHGPPPNGYTYSALLRGWKLNIDDANLLNDIIRMAIEADMVVTEPYVTTEILHCLAMHHRQKDETTAFNIVADAYAELFDVAPLQRLGLLLDKSQAEQKPTPNRAAIGIMVTAYLTHLRANNLPDTRAQQLYRRWRELMFSQEAPFAELAEQTYVYSAFLYYYARIPKGMLFASQIIKDMQAGPPENFPFAHAKPDVYCWSIYMFGFVRAGQMKLAEQILVYMREKGVEPTIDSRNILLSGYFGRQDLYQSLAQLKEAEEEGQVWNEYTLKALSRYRNQERLRAAYENAGLGKGAQTSSLDGSQAPAESDDMDELSDFGVASPSEPESVLSTSEEPVPPPPGGQS